jgi:hypothetical protein
MSGGGLTQFAAKRKPLYYKAPVVLITLPCLKLAARKTGQAAPTGGASRQNDAPSRRRDDAHSR